MGAQLAKMAKSTSLYGLSPSEVDEAFPSSSSAMEHKLVCFTDLPGELRNKVYTYALCFTERDFIDLEFAHLSEESRDEIVALTICPQFTWLELAHTSTLTPTVKGLNQVSRVVRAESISVYFSANKFRFWVQRRTCSFTH